MTKAMGGKGTGAGSTCSGSDALNEATGLEQYGYEQDFQSLRICGTCYDLYEENRSDGMEQHCRCHPRRQTWPGYDFDERAILCRCCGLEVLRSGSRWSSFFCRECQLLAMGVSVWQRQLVFPIGRHTLMHTWVPDTPASSLADDGVDDAELVEGVHTAVMAISKGANGLLGWYEVIMPQNLARVGLAGAVLVRDYLQAIDRKELGNLHTRLEAFEGLCEFFRTTPAEETQDGKPRT